MLLDVYKKEKFDIVIMAGQSNAEGFGVGPAAEEWLPDGDILWLNDASRPRFEKDEEDKDVFRIDYPSEPFIQIADEPIGEAGKVGKLSFYFARAYKQDGRLQAGRKLLVLNAAVGGTGFRDNQWGVGRTLYRRLQDFTRAALALNEENRLVAFLWHQGECDSFENGDWSFEKKYQTHKANLGGMLADFKREFACSKLPFIAGGFCDEWYLKNKAPCDAVLQAIREVCKEHGGFVKTSGLKSNDEQTGNGDDIHFCRDALHILGQKYYDTYKGIIK